MSGIFFTSDHHFFHRGKTNDANSGVIFNSNRPFANVEEMHEVYIENWNRVVRKNDIVHVLGDFFWKSSHQMMKRIIDRLNGKIIVTMGNHDKSAAAYIRAGVHNVKFNHFMQVGEFKVFLSHFPYLPQFDKIEDLEKYQLKHLHCKMVNDGKTWLFHGHVHNAWDIKDRMINVGVDQWNGTPVGAGELVKLMRKKEKEYAKIEMVGC